MSNFSVPSPPPGVRAFDSVLVEYRTVHRQPRVVFDDLAREAFEAAAQMTNVLLVVGAGEDAPSDEPSPVVCTLNPTVPGSYVLRYEIRETPEPEAPGRTRSFLRPQPRAARDTTPEVDAVLQEALISGNRETVELLLCIGVLTGIDDGRLSVTAGTSDDDPFVELVDGIRVLQRVHRSAWVLLQREDIQDCLRGLLAPFKDDQLYTMTLVENPHFNNLQAAYVITASQKLRDFVEGAALYLPSL
ncbi:hypothetical protein GWK18_10810 [Kocuria sp. JC486]|uniref:hypothetical protein n=1 Tax=Kocuria sp. JC486 TaxID=1970736 RepID=UPI001420AA94|nr:hypothetical protein [Kocuria sp. JC486]NHU86068.1 hypothetical protein [Kocuria sp. JC486]